MSEWMQRDAQNRRHEDERKHEERLQQRRAELRDLQWLSQPDSPAKVTEPTFLIGRAPDFPHVAAGQPDSVRGHMSEPAHTQFMTAMTEAARAPTPELRDQATARAANTVAHDLKRHNETSLAKSNQAGFSAMELRAAIRENVKELGQEAGLSPVAAQALGFSLQRALEREGIKTLVNHAVDGIGRWQASAASAATQLGQRFNLEKATKYLADHGLTGDKIKEFAGKHAGKISSVLSVTEHRAELITAMNILKESGVTVQAMTRLAGDKEVRSALGDVAMGGGTVASSMPGMRSVGSIAILTGALLKGESTEDMGKHVVRAVGAIAGGAVGSLGGVFGTVAGAEAGHYAADKLVEFYENRFEKDRSPPAMASREEGFNLMREGARAIKENDTVQDVARSSSGALQEDVKSRLASLTPDRDANALGAERGREREMEMSHQRNPGAA